eukprot:scaffold6957_cov65-Phaeocystis_antarctica.AAC.2
MTSASTRSTFSGSVTAVLMPSTTSMISDSPAAAMAARALAATGRSCSTAYTLPAPARAAAIASTANGPVPMSRTSRPG